MRPLVLAMFALVAGTFSLPAAEPANVSYVKDIKPFLAKYCLQCHSAGTRRGGLNLETYQAMMKGGNSFEPVKPGKPEDSVLVTMSEGRFSPVMPPKTAKVQPKKEEVALLRAWVAAGAKDDSDTAPVPVPDIKPREAAVPPVSAVAYRPDGKLLAAGGRQDVFLIETSKGEIVGKLPDQPAKVTAIGFSRDGKTLAVAGGVPGKSGEVRLYAVPAEGVPVAKPDRVIAAHADLVHGLAFSPDGKTLATAGYDRLVKFWDVATGKEVRALNDHSDAVYAVAFSPDGKLFASGSADRAVKVWDAATGKKLHTLGDATDWVYAVAFSPDGKHLAAASVDKSIRIWAVTPAEARLVKSAFAHEGPVLQLVYAPDGQVLYSISEDRTAKAWSAANLTERTVYPKQPDTPLALAVRPDLKQLAVGRFDGVLVMLDEATGKVQSQPLPVKPPPAWTLYPEIKGVEPNNSPSTGQVVKLPATLAATLVKAGGVDCYRFDAAAGQELGLQAVMPAGSKLEPVLQITDLTGRVLAEGGAVLGYKFDQPGTYALAVRDKDYRGGAEFSYRLHAGEVPVVTSVFPLGVPRGRETVVSLQGVHLGSQRTVKLPAKENVGEKVPVPFSAMGSPTVVVGEFPEVVHSEASVIATPGTGNGRIDQPGTTQSWRFAARKGQRLVVEIAARRLGSPLDSVIDILDGKGDPLPRATLRCVAKTYTVFRDHDSATGGIRIEAWNELAINDYLYVGTELIRIKALPLNPDADCNFFTVAGQRVGYLGTTPTHHSLGVPMYKVQIHPPGTTFPPNGLPIYTLNWTNDDGGPGYGKDSRLFFDPPADGEYQVRVADARGQGGPDFGYRLTVRPPRPAFNVSFSPTAPAVWRSGAVPITVTADRIDGYDGPIAVKLLNLPPGFSAPETTIPAGETTTAFSLFADDKAEAKPTGEPLKLVGWATIDGKELTREAVGGLPTVQEKPDIVTTVEQTEVVIRPGEQVTLTAKIERKNGFGGRVPVEVRGLPHGVHVLDVGLNGVLITERETSRAFVVSCEPWVEPQEHPIVVLARREGKNTEHAAKSVLLKVAPPKP